jgi:hypothetical protein
METLCPFCLGSNVRPVGRLKARMEGGTGRLMECEECEKWYWADRAEEAPALFMHCQTPVVRPQCCYEEVREVVLAAGARFLRRRLAEFNHLCAECPHGRFLPGPDTSGAPERLEIRRPQKSLRRSL